MKKLFLYKKPAEILLFVIIIFFLCLKKAFAIPPPTVVVNVGASLIEILGIILAFAFQALLIALGIRKRSPREKSPYRDVFLWSVVLMLSFVLFSTVLSLKRERFLNLIANTGKVPSDYEYSEQLKSRGVLDKSFDVNGECSPDLSADPDEIIKLPASEIVIIDIRSPGEYKSVTMERAKNIPASELMERTGEFSGKKVYLLEYGDKIASHYADMLRKNRVEAYGIRGGIRELSAKGRGFFLYTKDANDVTFMPLFLSPSEKDFWQREFGLKSDSDMENISRYLYGYKNIYRLWSTRDIKNYMFKNPVRFIELRKNKRLTPGALCLDLYAMSPEEIRSSISRLPTDAGIFIICDDLSTAYQGIYLGALLSCEGYNYLGRYPNPDEFHMVPAGAVSLREFLDNLPDSIEQGIRFVESQLARLTGLPFERSPWLLFLTFIVSVSLIRLALLPLSLFNVKVKAQKEDERKKSLYRPSPGFFNLFFKNEESLIAKVIGIIPDLAVLFFGVTIGFEIQNRGNFLLPFTSDAARPLLPAALLMALLFYISEKNSSLFQDSNAIATLPVLAVLVGIAGIFIFPGVFTAYVIINQLWNIAIERIYRKFLPAAALPVSFDEDTPPEPIIIKDEILDLSGFVPSEQCGMKASRLSRLIRAGFTVASGFVLTDAFLKKYLSSDKAEEQGIELIQSAMDKKQLKNVVVRSSNCSEDTSKTTMAGLFPSFHNINCENLEPAVKAVADSYKSGKSKAGGIIIQKQLEGDFWGVAFTADPFDPTLVSIDCYRGNPGPGIQETERPVNFKGGRISRKPFLPAVLNADYSVFESLMGHLMNIEDVFSGPQDIEWLIKGKEVIILQSRNQLYNRDSCRTDDPLLREKSRILKGNPNGWSAEPAGQGIGFPKPLSLDLYKKFYDNEGSLDIACRQLLIPAGRPADSGPVTPLFGRVYQESPPADYNGKTPTFSSIAARMHLMFLPFNGLFREDPRRVFPLASSARRLNRKMLFEHFRQITEHLINKHGVDLFKVNILLEVTMNTIKSLSGDSHVKCEELITACSENITPPADIENYPFDYELYLSGQYKIKTDITEDGIEKTVGSDRGCCIQSFSDRYNGRIKKELNNLAKLIELKEKGRLRTFQYYNLLSSVLSDIARLPDMGEDILFLTLSELGKLEEKGYTWELKESAGLRKLETQAFKNLRLPLNVKTEDIEKIGLKAVSISSDSESVHLEGIPVSGPFPVEGKALIIDDNCSLPDIPPDCCIIVALRASTRLFGLFRGIKGLVTEGGGILSHLSILAREAGIPYVAGCRGAVKNISDGKMIRLEKDGSVKLMDTAVDK